MTCKADRVEAGITFSGLRAVRTGAVPRPTLIEGGTTAHCLFLAPCVTAITARENEEGYPPGHLYALTEMNRQILLQRVRQRLPTDARERLQVGTYDETIRFNTILVNREIAVVQPYLSTARGVESPTYLVGRPASLNLASRWPLIDQRHLLRRATDQRGRPGTTDP